MSTNDTVILMSSGASGVLLTPGDFQAALQETCHALQLLADAEGAAHTIAIEVNHAASEDDAVAVGRAIARRSLFNVRSSRGIPTGVGFWRPSGPLPQTSKC
jgi:glutamate N-acetyltransferase/amino-acid N-acetyltransferase